MRRNKNKSTDDARISSQDRNKRKSSQINASLVLTYLLWIFLFTIAVLLFSVRRSSNDVDSFSLLNNNNLQQQTASASASASIASTTDVSEGREEDKLQHACNRVLPNIDTIHMLETAGKAEIVNTTTTPSFLIRTHRKGESSCQT
jgi:hypothetical protein